MELRIRGACRRFWKGWGPGQSLRRKVREKFCSQLPGEFVGFFFPTPTISKIQRLGDYRTSSGRDGGRVWGGRRGLARGGTRVWPVR